MFPLRHDDSWKSVLGNKIVDQRWVMIEGWLVLGSFLACIIGQMVVPFCDRKCRRKDKFGGDIHELNLKCL